MRTPNLFLLSPSSLISYAFLGDQDQKRKIHTIVWFTISQDKVVRGLGIKNLKIMNKAFLAKLAWRFATEQNKLWAKILYSKYAPLSWKERLLLEYHTSGEALSQAWMLFWKWLTGIVHGPYPRTNNVWALAKHITHSIKLWMLMTMAKSGRQFGRLKGLCCSTYLSGPPDMIECR